MGLNFSPSHPDGSIVKTQSEHRLERGIEMGEAVTKAGIDDAWENAQRISGGGRVTRAHFAQYIVKIGKEKRLIMYLNVFIERKTGYVPAKWCTIQDSIDAIHAAGNCGISASV